MPVRRLGKKINKLEKFENNNACDDITNLSIITSEMTTKYTPSQKTSPTSSKVFESKNNQSETTAPITNETVTPVIKEITALVANETVIPAVNGTVIPAVNGTVIPAVNETVIPAVNETDESTSTKHNTPEEVTMTYDSIILGLGIIGKLEIGYKLRLLEHSIAIDDRYLQSLQRAYSGDDRTKTIEYINKLIYNSEGYKNKLIIDIKLETNFILSSYRNLNFQLTELVEKLKAAEKGLENLKKTYDYDINIGVIFDNYIKHVNKICNDANLEIHLNE